MAATTPMPVPTVPTTADTGGKRPNFSTILNPCQNYITSTAKLPKTMIDFRI